MTRRPRHGRGTRRRPADRGAATIVVLAVGLILIGLGLAGAAVGAARVARHEARTAADLGALAGAMRVLEGPETACARADELVSRNGGRLAACTVDGLDLVVSVEVEAAPLPGFYGTARAAARAGPVRAG
ncbi:Rv3654c family TadE-like protein [Phytohabitans kaempferiae]|uniref:Rv3654c family TadE-like protein n=1 Tax=Phytohabitans kaempferiae TaxID=1620943 RepID=A0ABV6LWH3_9ACTN